MRATAMAVAGLAIALVVAAAIFGTPHVGWDYECRHERRGGEPCKVCGWCEYYGLQGKRILRGDECGKLIRLLPVDWGSEFGSGKDQP